MLAKEKGVTKRKAHMQMGVGAYAETPLCTPNGATLCEVVADPKLVTCAHCLARIGDGSAVNGKRRGW